tara:strand:+ start:1069 stop:1704 length:636 start_codon:yes stop_codon:yes gene_type:complete
MENEEIKVIRPFGPSIAKVKIPNELVETLNNYIDKIILDENKIKNLNYGDKLVGNVTQEFKLENEFIESSGYLKFLSESVSKWLKISDKKNLKRFSVLSSWIVRQFQNEYNPIHWHGGHVSGVGYLKVPNSVGKTLQDKKININGRLQLIHGSRQFLSPSSMVIVPEVGYYYFFPHYLMHVVYPFYGTQDERRSISFNAEVDEEIFNVYEN